MPTNTRGFCSRLIYFKIKLCLVVTLDFFSTKFSINDIYGNLLTYNVRFLSVGGGFPLSLSCSALIIRTLSLVDFWFIFPIVWLTSSVNNNKNLLTLWLIIVIYLLTSLPSVLVFWYWSLKIWFISSICRYFWMCMCFVFIYLCVFHI